MAHATICGVTLPGAFDKAEEAGGWIADGSSRAINGAWRADRAGRARTWRLSTIPMLDTEGEAFRKLLEGEGQAWSFDANQLSSKGLAMSGGSVTPSTGGKYGGRIAVGAGSAISAALASYMGAPLGSTWSPTTGWTLLCWKKLTVGDGGDGTTYYHHIATGSVTVTRGASANPASVTQYRNGVAGNYSMGYWIDVASGGTVGLYGYDNTNAATAYDGYDDVVVLPFALPSAAWATGLYTFCASRAWPSRAAGVVLGGNVAPDSGGVTVFGRVRRIAQRNLYLSGAYRNNARTLEVELEEAG